MIVSLPTPDGPLMMTSRAPGAPSRTSGSVTRPLPAGVDPPMPRPPAAPRAPPRARRGAAPRRGRASRSSARRAPASTRGGTAARGRPGPCATSPSRRPGRPRPGGPARSRWTRIWWVRPGDEVQLQQRPAGEPLADAVAGDRAAAVRDDGHPLAVLRVAADRRLDPPDGGRHRALGEREVRLAHPARLELRHDAGLGRVVAGDDQQPGRVAVEAVDDARPRDPGDAAVVVAAGEQRVDERALPVARAPGGRRGPTACRRSAGRRPRTRPSIGIVGSGSRWYGISAGGTSRVTAPPRSSEFARSRRPSSVDEAPLGDELLDVRARQPRPVGHEAVHAPDDLALGHDERPRARLDRRRRVGRQHHVLGEPVVELVLGALEHVVRVDPARASSSSAGSSPGAQPSARSTRAPLGRAAARSPSRSAAGSPS